jgi:hypothetical protein
MVKFEKKGRIKRVTLTEDGLDIAQKLEAVMKKLLQLDSSMKKTRKKK